MGSSLSKDQEQYIVSKLQDYLDCPCTYFEPMSDPNSLLDAYYDAFAQSKVKQDFVPLMLVVSDSLIEFLVLNTFEDNQKSEELDFTKEEVRAYRQALLKKKLKSGKDELAKLKQSAIENFYDGYEDDFSQAISEDGQLAITKHPIFMFNYGSKQTLPIILAKIPVTQAYQALAWVPFGGWNECPNVEVMLAIAKYWQDKYGAFPCLVGYDTLEFFVEQPVSAEDAMELALEQYVFAVDSLDQSEGVTVKSLAQSLPESNFWSFWWD